MNIISMSLYGNNPFYCLGAVENAKLVPIVYPEWKMRVYVGAEVDGNIVNTLNDLGCEILPHNQWPGMFWRFLAADDAQADYAIFRDADSRLNIRERVAVDQWIESGKVAHIMHDHPEHQWPILGGMWGIKCRFLNMRDQIDSWCSHGLCNDTYGNDCWFLMGRILPLIEGSAVKHGNNDMSFPDHPPYDGFVGKPIV